MVQNIKHGYLAPSSAWHGFRFPQVCKAEPKNNFQINLKFKQIVIKRQSTNGGKIFIAYEV